MVFYDDQDTVVACADVGYATEATTLYASFAGDNVAGFVRMRQGTNTSETGIFINIYSPDADAAPMVGGRGLHGQRSAQGGAARPFRAPCPC